MLSSPTINKILFLSPNPDAAILGCGATINKMVEQGKNVYCAILSPQVKSADATTFSEFDLEQELTRAYESLEVPRTNITTSSFEQRIYPEKRQQILDYLVNLQTLVHPDVVFVPSFDDMHQDHLTLAEESFRAFKETSIYSYELPWNRITTVINCYNVVSEKNIAKKTTALQQFTSQLSRGHTYYTPRYIKGLANTRGCAIQYPYAESFEIVRLIH